MRVAFHELEEEHGARRRWVWADLNQTPLTDAVQHLSELATLTETVPGGTVINLANQYVDESSRAELAVVQALASVISAEDTEAVSSAIRAVYGQWLDDMVRSFQDAYAADPDAYETRLERSYLNGTCLLFTDGLRYDLGGLLAEELRGLNIVADLDWAFAALPTVTGTAKPAISPVADELTGGEELDPTVAASGSKLDIRMLRKTLNENGWQTFGSGEVGDPRGKAWTEFGDIDKLGHNFGVKAATRFADEIGHIAGRVAELLDAGWERVQVVTDHGFLLMPGQLSKVELPNHLAVVRKGRCARLQPNVDFDQQTVPWRWDPDVRFAVAPGLACYQGGKEYEHGGLSPQECVVPIITASRPMVGTETAAIEEAKWAGMRLRIRASGAASSVDLRTKPGLEATSVIGGPTALDDGAGSMVVADPDLEGTVAMIVVLSPDGRLLAQQHTTIGGD